MISLIRELLECFTRLNILQDLEWAQNACTEACERTERSRVARLTALNAARTGGAVTGAAPNGGACGGSSSSSRIVSTTPTGDRVNALTTAPPIASTTPNGRRVNALTTAPLNGGRVNAQQVLDILDRELRSKEIAISDLFDRYAIEIEIEISDLFHRYAIEIEIEISDLFDRYAIEIEIEISDPFDRYAIRSRRAGTRGAGCMQVLTTASARPQVCKRRAGTRNGQQRPSRRRVGRGPEGDARSYFRVLRRWRMHVLTAAPPSLLHS